MSAFRYHSSWARFLRDGFFSLDPAKKYLITMFLISCTLLGVFTIVIYEQEKISKNYTHWVIHSYEVLRLGRISLIDAIDLTNAEQNYITSGSSSYLPTYNAALADLDKEFSALAKEVNDNPEQEQNVATLRNKIEQLTRIAITHMDAKRHGQVSVYSMQRSLKDLQRAIVDVRTTFDIFSQNEVRLLDARAYVANANQRHYVVTLITSAILGLGALILANIIVFYFMAKITRAEEKLRKSEELFAFILDGLNDGIFDYDIVTGRISYSPSYRTMLGYEAEELGSDHDTFYHFVHPDDLAAAQETMNRYIKKEIPYYLNIFRVRHKNGHWVWLMSRGIGIKDKNGNIRRLVGTHTDITIQKQREEELNYFIRKNEQQQAELAIAKEKAEAANEAKSNFLAIMSHEIRTPMNVVIGLAEIFLKSKLDHKQREIAETLHANAAILLQLVNDLLDLTRIESGQIYFEAVPFTFDDLFQALNRVFITQASSKDLGFSLVNNTGAQSFLGDSTHIQQILVNLIGNALKFTMQGNITVTATSECQDESTSVVHISVTDTGVGIPAEKLGQIFDKFVQADQTISRRFGGSGLGLAICKSLANLMGGDITVSSQIERGSIFTFSLPLKHPIEQPKSMDSSASVPLMLSRGLGETILVVEDYTANIMVATLILENVGYSTDIATNGAEALKKLGARSFPYKAILMDVQMHGMDGYETTRRIRALEKEKGFRHLIIGVTAHALAGDRDKCLKAGMDDYMSKPIQPEILIQKLGQAERVA